MCFVETGTESYCPDDYKNEWHHPSVDEVLEGGDTLGVGVRILYAAIVEGEWTMDGCYKEFCLAG